MPDLRAPKTWEAIEAYQACDWRGESRLKLFARVGSSEWPPGWGRLI